MARRLSQIAARFKRIRGLDPADKAVFVHIGELVDSLINNRAPTNPGADNQYGQPLIDPNLPPPKNLVAKVAVRAAQVTWDPVNSSYLNNYRATYTNLSSGISTTLVVYTNQFVISDATGPYRVDVVSVGRGNVVSPTVTLDFIIPDDVIVYAGAKNGSTTAANAVSQTVQCPANEQIFGWVSFVLDSFWDSAGPVTTNIQISVGPTLAASVPLTTISVAPEEASVTNLPNSGGDAAIRPGSAPARTAMYETAMCAGVGPFTIGASGSGGLIMPDQPNRFWAKVTNRDPEADVIGLAINLFVITGGLGVFTPGFNSQIFSVNLGDITWFQKQEAAAFTLGIETGSFTVSWWEKDATTNPFVDWFADNNNLGSPDGSNITVETVGGNAEIVLQDSGYNQLVSHANGITCQDAGRWTMLTVVYNGSSFAWYRNAIAELSATTAVGSFSGFTPPTFGEVTVQGSSTLFNFALWNVGLSASEISAIFNAGAAANLGTTIGAYTHGANLKHWWRTAADVSAITQYGADSGNATPLLNISDNQLGVTAGCLVSDVPTVLPSPVGYVESLHSVFTGNSSDATTNSVLTPAGTWSPTYPSISTASGVSQQAGPHFTNSYPGVEVNIGQPFTIAWWLTPLSPQNKANAVIMDTLNCTQFCNNFNFNQPVGDAFIAAIRVYLDNSNTDLNHSNLLVELWDTTGTLFKQYQWNALFASYINSWTLMAITWDGTTLELSMNGTNIAASSKNTDNAGSIQTSDDMLYVFMNGSGDPRVTVGDLPVSFADNRGFASYLYSIGIWGVVLSNAELGVLNSGGGTIDYRHDIAGFSESANLLHWWRITLPNAGGSEFIVPGNDSAPSLVNGPVSTISLNSYNSAGFSAGDLIASHP